MMNAAQLTHRPFAESLPGVRWWQRIVWNWWLVRLPMFLLAAPAAYGVGAFADEKLPIPIAILAGLAFEATYIGAIAAADQWSENDSKTGILWWCVNVAAVLASVASNLLFFSGGTYASITAESATHAVPLPILGFFYGLLVHRVAGQSAQRAEDYRKEDEEERRKKRYACSSCSHWRGESVQAFHGHKRGKCVGELVDTWVEVK